jgi:hypothetical protein
MINSNQLREWKGITLEDIDKQWKISKDVHPSAGQQLGHFAAGIDQILKDRNHDPNARKNNLHEV